MKNFNRINTLFGWLAFVIALVSYLLTMEKTGSLWDCGEFVSSAYKLQVPHPPGAPLFIIIGKVFSLFAFGRTEYVALMINSLSAVSTAFTTLFFYFSASMLLRIALKQKSEDLLASQGWFVVLSSFVGAMAATYLDSMWFNAIEGEVYALSVFFMGFNVWAILKWYLDESEDQDRWLVAIALATGLSTGVHLLSLLVIPFMTYIFYIKRFEETKLGSFIAFASGVPLIGFVMTFILSWTPGILGKFDLFFVNSLNTPFFIGSCVATMLIFGGLAFLIHRSYHNPSFLRWNEDKFKLSLNTLFLMIFMLYMGFLSYFIVVIRANANTPINMNVPNNFLTLKSYIDRDQYPKRALLNGPYYTHVEEPEKLETISEVYEKNTSTGKYELIGRNPAYVYRSQDKRIFPRIGHEGEDKKTFYRAWLNPSFNVVNRATGEIVQSFEQGQEEQAEQFAQAENAKVGQPLFAVKDDVGFLDNISYLVNYQFGFMYMRYLMWNLVGRNNDLQGHIFNDNGRWISGINFIDNILGNFWGNANLDQAGKPEILSKNKAENKFYFIPLILCILGMFFTYKRNPFIFNCLVIMFITTGFMQIIYSNQPPIEPRERDYVFAPSFWGIVLWMPFGILMIKEWLEKYLKGNSALFASIAIGMSAPILMGFQGWDDHNRDAKRTSTLAFAKNVLNSCPPNALLLAYGDNDTYPLWYAQEIEGIRTDVRVVNTSLIEGYSYITQVVLPMNKSEGFLLPFSLDQIKGDLRSYLRFSPQGHENSNIELSKVLKFVTSDNPKAKIAMNGQDLENYIPTRNVYINLDLDSLVKNNMMSKDDAAIMRDNPSISFQIGASMTKGALVQYGLLAENLYNRPFCISLGSGGSGFLGMDKFFQVEGMVYVFNPAAQFNEYGGNLINIDKSYAYVMNYDFGGADKNILLDDNTLKSYHNIKQSAGILAFSLAVDGKIDSCNKIIEHIYKNMPKTYFPYNNFDLPFLQAAIIAKNEKVKNELAQGLYNNSVAMLDWMLNANNAKRVGLGLMELRENFTNLRNVKEMLAMETGINAEDKSDKPSVSQNSQGLTKKIEDKLKFYESQLQQMQR
ncbi:MAG: DUF2723 domain-containing protein [Chitinophagales bacterium]|nr:DUF2723 domain-containing protein [Chitinophagales bacterium]